MVFGPPLERRRDEWFKRLSEAVNEIQASVAELSTEKLSENEVFVTTAIHATQIALRTHREEKLEALRNAVVNAPQAGAPDETLQQIFLNCVDTLTPMHLRILTVLHDPNFTVDGHKQAWPVRMEWKAAMQVLFELIPEMKGQREFYDLIFADLQQRGLLKPTSPHQMVAPGGALPPQTTDIGKRFLQFISRR